MCKQKKCKNSCESSGSSKWCGKPPQTINPAMQKNCTKIIDVREYGDVDLNIKLSDGQSTVIKVRNMSKMKDEIEKVKQFNRTLRGCKELVQGHCEDDGKMKCFGLKNKKEGQKPFPLIQIK